MKQIFQAVSSGSSNKRDCTIFMVKKVHLENSERNITALMTLAPCAPKKIGLQPPSLMESAIQTSTKTWMELLSYCILILGTLGDYISTHIGLTHENLWERNPITSQLLANRMWLPVNLVIIMFGIAIPFLIIRFSNEDYRYILSFPIVTGITRLFACIWNYSLII